MTASTPPPSAVAETRTAQVIAFPDRMAGREPPRTKRFIADFYSVSTKTIERWMKDGCPHYHEPGRTMFVLSEVKAWYRQRRAV